MYIFLRLPKGNQGRGRKKTNKKGAGRKKGARRKIGRELGPPLGDHTSYHFTFQIVEL